MIKLVILAGGKGTRLGVSGIPKPMITIAGKPVLEHQIELARRYNIREIYILSGYLSEMIRDYFNESFSGIKIHHFTEDRPLGTAGAIKMLEEILDEPFLVFYGDVVLDFDIASFVSFSNNHASIADIVVHPNDHPYDSDLIETGRDNIVTGFHPKPHAFDAHYPNLVNAAVYILRPEIFRYIEKDKPLDFGKDIFPNLIDKGEKIYAYRTSEYIKDMGTPDRFKKVENDILTGKVAGRNISNMQKAIFLDRDGVLNYNDDIVTGDKLKLMPDAAKAVKAINNSDYLAVLVTNQPAVAKGFISEQELHEAHNKLEFLLGLEDAYLDRIYYCPHHPEKGHPGEIADLKVSCECRKPNTGMITRAAKDLNIDLSKSYIIGDSFRDIMCGKNAGLCTIGVRTGEGLKKNNAEPDYFFDDLCGAVDFLTNCSYAEHYSSIREEIRLKKNLPFIISIGGVARSGKTILTNFLSRNLSADGYRVLIVSLDNWLLSKEDRKDGFTVYDRFQLKKINADFAKFFNTGSISVNKYSALERRSNNVNMTYKNDSFDVIIIDGIPALSSETILENSDIKIFCDIEDKLLYSRFCNFYNWKGLTGEQIENEFRSRMQDEYSLIRLERGKADIIITYPD